MRIVLVLLGLLVASPSLSLAQGYPSKNVTLVVPFAPGGASDIMGRAVGQKLSERWKQPVIIDNRPGASTTTGTAYVATQPADGYTLLLAPLPFVIMPNVYKNLKYNALEDFRAASVIAYYPLVVTVNASSPIKDLKGLFDHIRANPGAAYASVGPGSSPHLLSAYMSKEEKLNTVHVPYRSGGQVMSDLISGRVLFYAAPSTEVLSQIKAGTLRAISVLSDTRMKQLPDVSTSVEQGFKKYVGSSWSSIVVPAKTPQAVIDKVNADIAAVIKDPSFRDTLEEQGAQFMSVNAKEAQDFLVKEMSLWAPMVEASGIEPPNN